MDWELRARDSTQKITCQQHVVYIYFFLKKNHMSVQISVVITEYVGR